MVSGWGYFLIQGVRDPLGGINSLWPLFGIANQMLAAIALCLATTIILKNSARESQPGPPSDPGAPTRRRSPWFALVTFVPLVWLVAVTFTAGVQKILHADPRIGFLAQADNLNKELPALEQAVAEARTAGDSAAIGAAEKALRTNRTLGFNNRLDAVVAAAFLGLVSVIVVLSVREWVLLLARRKPAVLRESEPVWLADYAVIEGGRRFSGVAGTAALTVALARELSGEAHFERARHEQAGVCTCPVPGAGAKSAEQLYLEVTEHRFNGVRRCC